MNAVPAPVPPAETVGDVDPLRDPALYFNRELSQLAFNFRVLAQARDPQVPLLERLRYLCISCTNLDEFFEIRAATVRHAQDFGLPAGPDGMPQQIVLKEIHDRAAELVDAQYRCWNEELRPQLNNAGVRILPRDAWSAKQTRWLREYFCDEILPVLSPLGLDPAHPFPKILNKSLNIVVVLKGKDAFGRAGHLAIVRAPRSLPRIIQIPPKSPGAERLRVPVRGAVGVRRRAVPRHAGEGRVPVPRHAQFRADRRRGGSREPRAGLRDELVGRGYLRAMRLEIAEQCPNDIVRTLLVNFDLPENAVYRINGPVNLNRVIQVYDLVQRPDLKYPPFQPRVLRDIESMFERVEEGDVLLHHPFDSFAPVLELIKQAAEDPNVLAIKQTLYRTGKESPIVEQLVQAARNGKDVTVVVELRARFDEEANLGLADRLQDAGVQVVYGVVGYKTHAKMLLIVRREGRKLRRYVHLGTGNYHSGTARAYTDFGLITADPDIGNDVDLIFRQLSGPGARRSSSSACCNRRSRCTQACCKRIDRETQHARAASPAASSPR
jgi:polyphosphate kinase